MYIKNISKSFNELMVLDNLSLEFNEGEIYCIMGKSGCGKSTLLNIIMGLIKADKGEISDDFNNISVVFQEDRLCTKLNAAANVKIVCDKNITEDAIAENLYKVGLDRESILKPVSELSGGMKRRVAVVRAIMAKSKIIIMDEAFKGLDVVTRTLTAEYILSNRQDRTVIFVTHDIEEAELLNGKVIQM